MRHRTNCRGRTTNSSVTVTVTVEHPHVKAVFGCKKTSLVKIGPQNDGFRKFKGLNIKYSYRDPKRHFLIRNDVFRRRPTLRKNPFRGVALWKNPKNEEKTSHPQSMAKSRIWGTETPEPIDTKFCLSSAVHEVITHANFCEDRLRGFGVAKGRILAFSINLLRRLPCECVITVASCSFHIKCSMCPPCCCTTHS